MRVRTLHLALLGLGLGAAPLLGQVTVTGVVREDGTRRPLPAVVIQIEGTKRQTTSDSAGRYRIDAPSGNRVALFRTIGHHPLRLRLILSKGDSVTADADLVKQLAQELEPLETTAKPTPPRGFGYESFGERRKLGLGKFMDSVELRRYEGRKVADVLRGIQGLRIIYFAEDSSRPWNYEWRVASQRKEAFADSFCWMSVVLDGSPIYRFGSRSRPPDFRTEMFSVSTLAAVEVYRSASEVPLEFGGPAEECGLLMLWTRRGQ